MLNTMNITKAAGAVLGAFLAFLVTYMISSAYFTIGGGHHAEAEAVAEAPAASPATEATAAAPAAEAPAAETAAAPATEAPAADAAAAAAPVVAAAAAGGDAAAGQKVFGKCKACHKVDGKNAVGPHLDGVVGRAVGSVEGFKYSDPMIAHGGEWTAERIDAYLADPKATVPGNKMAFAGLKKPEDRANVIAYLQSLQ